MYRVNPLLRKVLITTDEVIANSHASDNPDVKVLQSSIQIAEDRFIKPMIGWKMYDELRNAKNTVVSSSNKATLESKFPSGTTLEIGQIVNAIELVESEPYKNLWNEYLCQLIAECVVYTASPVNYSKFTAQGEMNNNPQAIAMLGSNSGSGSASVKRTDMQWKMDHMLMNRIDPLIASMHEWICRNKGDFPLYAKPCKCDEDGVSMKRKSAWIDLYEDDKEKCRKC